MHARRRAFSLVETVVVVGITVFLAAILLSYSRTSEKQIVFFKEQAVLAAALSRAKSYAVDTFQPSVVVSPGYQPTESTEKICGWGIHFEQDGYVLFRDMLALDGKCTATSTATGYVPSFTPDTFPEAFEQILFGQNSVRLADFRFDGVPAALPIDAVFIPPDPKTSFYANGKATANELTFTLTLADGSRTTKFVINKIGQISIE